MAPEPPASTDPDPDAASTDAWLAGLAGRPGHGAAHADGQRLRAALASAPTPATLATPAWAEIERRAAGDVDGPAPVQPPAGTTRPPPRPSAAANEARWRPVLAWAAMALMGAAVLVSWQPWQIDAANGPDTTLRGVGAAPADAALWRVAEPDAAARALADELRALGAHVDLQTPAAGAGAGLLLSISAPPAAAAAVNQRLAGLETALDAEGRLRLRISAP